MIRLLIFIFLLLITQSSYAIDETEKLSQKKQIGEWIVLEFLMPNQIIYRLATTSINEKEINIVFDYIPTKDCIPSPAIMVLQSKSYANNSKEGEEGVGVMEYKIPNQRQSTQEIVKTVVSEGHKFLAFSQLTAKSLLVNNRSLAIWVPASGDGEVKRSGNIYFSLDGFTMAYKEAKRLCDDQLVNKKSVITSSSPNDPLNIRD